MHIPTPYPVYQSKMEITLNVSCVSNTTYIRQYDSYIYWKTFKMGEHFPVREKSENFTQNIGQILHKILDCRQFLYLSVHFNLTVFKE